MEFLRIGEAKLKIVMMESDMESYGVKFEGESCDRAARRSIWSILDVAKAEVGFDPDGDKVLIQFYPQKGAGCEVFVTKLGILPDSSARLVSKSDRITLLSKRRSYFRFDSPGSLALAARAIISAAGEECVESDVYDGGASGFFLSIEEYGKGGEPAEFPQISEFGERLTAECGAYISEHFDRLTDGDGVGRFASL